MKKKSKPSDKTWTPKRVNALAEWVEAQRRRYKEGSLAAWQIKKLESVEGWTWEAHANN